MLKLGIADECCEAIHIHLAMMQSNYILKVSSQLVGGVKDTFIESSNSGKVTRARIK